MGLQTEKSRRTFPQRRPARNSDRHKDHRANKTKTNQNNSDQKEIKEATAPFTDIPILFVSALNKQRIHKAVELFMAVNENLKRHITTHKLNEFLIDTIENYQPPAVKGKFIKIKFITQLHTKTPSFVMFCNLPQYIQENYKRYLENKFRDNFDFTGVPLSFYFRKKS